MTPRSAPAIFSPSGVRKPVVSISMRPLMGMVQPLARPGICSAAFIWLMSCSCEMRSGVMWRSTAASQPGAQPEYHVSTCRHCDLGLRVITVSSIESGAGSVAVSRAARFAQHAVHFGELPQYPVGDLEHLLRFADGNARHGGRHVKDGALLQRRHELGAELEDTPARSETTSSAAAAQHQPFVPQHPRQHRIIQADQHAADGMLGFGTNPSGQQASGQAAQPLGPEAECPDVSEGHAQRRIERDGQHGGDDHREALGVGQRLEQPPFLRFEGQHRQKRHRDDQQRKEAGAGDLLDRAHHHFLVVPAAAFTFPLFQALVDLLDHHDGGIHQRADGNGNAGRAT